MMPPFLEALRHYLIEVLPALAIGFLLSGLIHALISTKWVERYLGARGIRPIFYSTLIGTVLPICCWGSLPVALELYKKGSRLGPILAFLVATPATSISALIVSYKLLGPKFTIYIFFSVILMGLVIGFLGNIFEFKPRKSRQEICPECKELFLVCEHGQNFSGRIKSILRFSFLDMPREIGLEVILGLILAAAVASFFPIGRLIRLYLSGAWAYPFSLVFGLVMYFCSTASVPLVDAFLKQGMNMGGGMVLLLVGPITSYGTILVLRKEFGLKILTFYIASICTLSLMLGYLYQIIR